MDQPVKPSKPPVPVTLLLPLDLVERVMTDRGTDEDLDVVVSAIYQGMRSVLVARRGKPRPVGGGGR